MDILGQHKPRWNASTHTNSKFPDRPMMRTLAVYDACKRADYNCRAERLAHRDTALYIPRGDKFHISPLEFLSEEERQHPDRRRPPKQKLGEMVVNDALAAKPAWIR